ncbi:MAG: DUF3422 domain-containing protein [Pseudomonadales bacterium]
MRLPGEYVDRDALFDEIHARPSDALQAPLRVSYLALLSSGDGADRERDHVAALASRFDAPLPLPGANHYSAALGDFALKWERHTEFARYTVTVPGSAEQDGGQTALDRLPADWISGLAGELIVAAHCTVYASSSQPPQDDPRLQQFDDGGYVGSRLAGGAATFYTDFRLGPDRFSRFLVYDLSTSPYQLGRTVQRLLEIHTYWLLALRGLPVARALDPYLASREASLRRINQSLATAQGPEEAELLTELIRLEAEISDRTSDNAYRFGASRAYHGLVQQRLGELREERLPGLQTLTEFTERRLGPAMRTCLTAEERLVALLERAGRATQLLATRVSVTSELQNQAVLRSMDRRTQMQLRLQQTVEGLSVAAITYYVVGLVGYLVKGIDRAGVPLMVDVVVGLSIPLVALLVWLGVRRIRRAVESGA